MADYDYNYMTAADYDKTKGYKQAYQTAQTAGDTTGMSSAHSNAETVRAKYNYSGGVAGDEYIPLVGSAANGNSGAGSATGTKYDPNSMTSTDYAKIQQLGKDWEAAYAAGDTAGMQTAHDTAEAIRNSYGYSGGDDGTGYTRLSSTSTTYLNAAAPTYTSTTIPDATDLTEYIKNKYAANLESNLANYEGAYKNSLATIDANAAKIPQTYQSARNEAAGSYQQTLRNAAEYANASGLNSGAAAQARLSTGNTYASNISSIAQQESDALADLDLERTQLANTYQMQIAQAKADNNAQLAEALYNEYVRLDDAAIDKAKNQSSLDYNTWYAAYQAYQDAQTKQQEAQEQLANTGWQLLAQGVIPSSDQLAAMGITADAAQSYVNKQGADTGWQLLEEGVMPSDTQLAAMGITADQAQSYLNQQGADAGWTLLKSGIMPSDTQLAAMGITKDQAYSYIYSLVGSSSGSSSGGSGGSSSKKKSSDDSAATDGLIDLGAGTGSSGNNNPLGIDAVAKADSKNTTTRKTSLSGTASDGSSGGTATGTVTGTKQGSIYNISQTASEKTAATNKRANRSKKS